MSGRLSDLVTALSLATGFPRESTDVLATHLRKARLVTTGPRGVHAPRMTTPDVANLLFALLGARQLRDAPQAVRLCRDLRLREFVDATGLLEGPEPPPEGLFGLDRDHSLGEIVEALLEEYSYGDCRYPPTGFVVTRLDLRVTVPGESATLMLWSGGWAWGARYYDSAMDEALHARLVAEHGDNWRPAFEKCSQERYGDGATGDLRVTREVGDRTFYVLGEFLHFGSYDPHRFDGGEAA